MTIVVVSTIMKAKTVSAGCNCSQQPKNIGHANRKLCFQVSELSKVLKSSKMKGDDNES